MDTTLTPHSDHSDRPGAPGRAPLTFRSMTTPEEAEAFRALNEEWISRFFTLEPNDVAYLADPFAKIMGEGGDVLIARHDGEIVGCVALVPTGNGVFELSKMVVAPSVRGLGLGRQIIAASIDRAREMGAASLFLGSNTKLANAVHLYESAGFTHVPRERLGPLPYERANVFMELTL